MGLVYVTGSQYKADYLKRFLDTDFSRVDINLDEIQSLDLKEVVTHKAKQAYEIVKQPVIVEDTSLEFKALGRLPGTFIKFFCEELDSKTICDLVKNKDNSATARCMFAYYDGEVLEIFAGSIEGSIEFSESGDNGFGWDKFFIAKGNTKTNANLNKTEYQKMYLSLKPISNLSKFLKTR